MKKIRNVWFKRQFPGVIVCKTDEVYEIAREEADFSKPVYEGIGKLYIIKSKEGVQV